MKCLKILAVLATLTFITNICSVYALQTNGKNFVLYIPGFNGHATTSKIKKQISLEPQILNNVYTERDLDVRLKYDYDGSIGNASNWEILRTNLNHTFGDVSSGIELNALQKGWKYYLYIDSRPLYLNDTGAVGIHWAN
jgi:hypothetical protein